jgi:flavin reductase (DIM6/NTAB) family NADH-FMN oxidoreductase RutF
MQSFPPSSADSYKALARTWTATVTVVTTRCARVDVASDALEIDGFTATAFFTVSIDPPIVAVSASKTSTAASVLSEAAAFAVNLLGVDSVPLAQAFAKSRVERRALWEKVPWTRDDDGVPLLGGAVGAFSAHVRQVIDAGDHALVLGDVTAIHLGQGTETLIYHNRSYGHFVPRDGA